MIDHVTRIIGSIAPGDRADLALRHFFEAHRWLSPAEKSAITRSVFNYFRWINWTDRDASLRKQVETAESLQAKFDRDPASIKAEALAALAVPEWLREEMELPAEYLRQLQGHPALWIRARPGTRDELAAALGDCHATAAAPDALRYAGRKDLFRTEQFQNGQFEIQDLASQLVGIACTPSDGQTWWDVCAGEGGKTMHLADLMKNKGLIWASDRSARRLDTLKRRAARARVFNYRAALWEAPSTSSGHTGAKLPTKTKFDGVLVDAPCSGVGTWQRNPHARWTTTREDVRELAAVQLELLGIVAPAVKPGGRLVYSVCTLTQAETTGVESKFAAANPGFEPSSSEYLWPQKLNANGMFIASWTRKTKSE